MTRCGPPQSELEQQCLYVQDSAGLLQIPLLYRRQGSSGLTDLGGLLFLVDEPESVVEDEVPWRRKLHLVDTCPASPHRKQVTVCVRQTSGPVKESDQRWGSAQSHRRDGTAAALRRKLRSYFSQADGLKSLLAPAIRPHILKELGTP